MLKVEKMVVKLLIWELFGKKYLCFMLLLWFLFFVIMFCFYFISLWIFVLLKEVGMIMEESINVGMMILFGGVVGLLVYGLIVSCWFVCSVLMLFIVVFLIVIVVFIFLSVNFVIVMVFGVVVGVLINGCISGLYIINLVIYDVDICNIGVGWVIGVGCVGLVFVLMVVGILFDLGWGK